ncbi:MAG: glycosyltransferase [Flavobacteriales bacterium]
MQKPQLSIVVPVFNAEKTLATCLESISNLSGIDAEIIVIDGHSTDKSLVILEQYISGIQHLIVEPDNGVYEAMNKGIRLAKGEWIYFLGADDYLNDVEVLRGMLIAKGEELLRIAGVEQFNASHSKVPQYYPAAFDKRLVWRNVSHHQGILYHHSIFENKIFNEELKVLADYSLNLELFNEGTRAKLFPGTLAKCAAQGISKNFQSSLYAEEWSFKKKLLTGWKKLVQPLWLKAKKWYKR